MDRTHRFFSVMLSSMVLTAGMAMADDDGAEDANYCMDVDIEAFYMTPDVPDDPKVCTVRDYRGGELQEAFYPFTQEDHLFNCEYFGPFTPLPMGYVPSAVMSQEDGITGTIGGHPFSADLYCASLTNWYQDSCEYPDKPDSCTVQLAQPFLKMGLPFPRITEVSVFDGVITVEKRNKTVEVPLVMATRAAGAMHLEKLDPFKEAEVGATITHSALGMLTYKDDSAKVLDGSLDLLLQGHIFYPPDKYDDSPAVIKGTICSKDLYKLLNKTGGGGKGKKDDDD